jgi:SOS response regulatory protein OraA/RecX
MYRLRKSSFDPSFVEIYDGETVHEEVSFPHLLRKTPSFETIEAAKAWLEEEERKRARRRAVAALARRDLPSSMMTQKLKEKGFSGGAIRKALENLPIDDDAFWERTVAREFGRGYGPYKIEEKWVRRGMPKGYAFSKISPEMQKQSIEKAFTKGKTKEAVARSLIRKGFDISLVEKLFRLKT